MTGTHNSENKSLSMMRNSNDAPMIPGEGATPCSNARRLTSRVPIPMTVTGKVQKYLMREETVKEMGLEEQETA